MTLAVKEYQHNNFTGEVTIEYADDSTRSFNMNDVVTSVTNPVTGGITKIWSGTQAEYDAIATPADDTLYIIVEA